MIAWVSAPVSILSTLGLAWISTRKRRILPPAQKIINQIHPGELDKIKQYQPRDHAIDILKVDAEFWECIGGFRGLLRKRKNAVLFVQLCQLYVRHSNMDKNDAEFFSRRAFAIGFLILASIPEQGIRLFWRGMPHFCAQWIAYLYWEVATEIRMLSDEYETGHLTV